MKKGVSELIGQAVFGDGSKGTAYRALRQLVCASCGGAVAGGEMFTRDSAPGQNLRLWPRCQACVPFTLESGRPERSSLIELLLTPTESKQATAATEGKKDNRTNDERRKAIAAMRKRLGPALERSRQTRFGNK